MKNERDLSPKVIRSQNLSNYYACISWNFHGNLDAASGF